MKKIIIIVLASIVAVILFVVGLYLTSPSTLTPNVDTGTTPEQLGGIGGTVGTSGGQNVGVTQPAISGSGLAVSTTTSEVSPTDTTSVTTTSGTPMTTLNFIDTSTTVQDVSNADYFYLADTAPSYTPSISEASTTEMLASNTSGSVPATTLTISAMSASVGGKPYLITYTQSTSYFNITLLQEPIGTTRLAAEEELQRELGIDQKAMCNLNYTVAVPWSVNQVYSGMDLGFSFCSDGVRLP